MELNATAFGYLTLLFIVIASFAIGLKLVYERKHETSDRAGQPLTSQKAGCSDFFALLPIRWLTPLVTSVLTQHT